MSWEEIVAATYEVGQRRSMVGPGDVREHLEHARELAAALEPPARAVDLGSGAGIPGLVLAGIWSQSRWVLLDAARRRTQLLGEAVARLGWSGRVEVRHARAEELGRDLGHRGRYDLVTARLFGPPAVAAECGAPLLRLGGLLAVTEPLDPSPSRWSPTAIAPLGLKLLPPQPGRQLLEAVRPPEERFPRRPGVPERRPLF